MKLVGWALPNWPIAAKICELCNLTMELYNRGRVQIAQFCGREILCCFGWFHLKSNGKITLNHIQNQKHHERK
jgi:hypothetical protein